jgi:Bacterial toxin 44
MGLDYGSTYYFIYEIEIESNIHYGFIGRQIGFNSELLKRAAGFAQAGNFSVPDGWLGRWLVQDLPLLSSLDDPRDQEAIALGMVLSEKFGRSVTDADLIKEMRPRLGRLIELNKSVDK